MIGNSFIILCDILFYSEKRKHTEALEKINNEH